MAPVKGTQKYVMQIETKPFKEVADFEINFQIKFNFFVILKFELLHLWQSIMTLGIVVGIFSEVISCLQVSMRDEMQWRPKKKKKYSLQVFFFLPTPFSHPTPEELCSHSRPS